MTLRRCIHTDCHEEVVRFMRVRHQDGQEQWFAFCSVHARQQRAPSAQICLLLDGYHIVASRPALRLVA